MKKYTNKEVIVEYQGQEILDIPMKENDAGAETIGEYLTSLLSILWFEKERFSGKRPFGNSGWEDEIYHALAYANAIKADFCEWEYEDAKVEVEVLGFDAKKANELILEAIQSLYSKL